MFNVGYYFNVGMMRYMNIGGNMTPYGTVLQVVCNFNMLYIGCQYQVIKKVKKKRKADLPYLSFLQDEIGNTHIFFFGLVPTSDYIIKRTLHGDNISCS